MSQSMLLIINLLLDTLLLIKNRSGTGIIEIVSHISIGKCIFLGFTDYTSEIPAHVFNSIQLKPLTRNHEMDILIYKSSAFVVLRCEFRIENLRIRLNTINE